MQGQPVGLQMAEDGAPCAAAECDAAQLRVALAEEGLQRLQDCALAGLTGDGVLSASA